MDPVDYPQSNVVYAKEQPEYLPLQAHRTADGEVTSCWRLSWRERLKVLFRGRIFITQLTFNQPLQPIRPAVAMYLEPYANGILKRP